MPESSFCGARVVPDICFWPLSLRPNPLEPEVCAEGLATCWVVGVRMEPSSLPGGTDHSGYAWACNFSRKRSLRGRGGRSWEERRGGKGREEWGTHYQELERRRKKRKDQAAPPTSGAAETNEPAPQGEGHLLVSTG